ncbi:MAG: hypothetical protein JKY30_13740, partial [Flavobacteriales bacterium]|nr:hypothetical protein [Flavobacteriales bacterium]
YYEKALAIFPTEDYPDFQLGDISDKLAGMEAANKKYKAAIVRADKAFAERDWGKATTNYEQASLLKESEQYPKDKIKEIKTIQSSEKKVAKDYNEAIAVADQQMLSRDYDNAKLNYEKALRLKSYEKYPKEKIIEIETILTEKAKKDKDYNDAVAAADVQFKAKDYEASIESYKKALNFKSEEQYPKNKIDEATRLIAEMKLQKKTYDNFIVEADAAFSKKDYTVAKSNYEKAVNLFAEEQYPKDKLTEIKSLIEAAEKLDADYVNAIKIGDKALASKEYEGAKTAYEKALGFKSEEQYPRDKIIEIASLIAGLAKAKEKEEEYLKLIDSADKLLGDKSYEDAKSKYSDALGVKLGEQYPKDRIIEIDGLIAALAKTEADKKAKDEKYQQLISVADQLLGNKSYEDAKNKYNEALGVKSEEQYPKDKITKIDGLLADIAKAEAEAKAKEEQYQQLIISADKLLGGKNYEDAKNKYNEALGVKSEEQYPKDKLKEIEDTLAEIARKKAEEESAKLAGEEREAKYKGVIAVADNSMVTKDYAKAKLKYNEALGIKSGEQYPTDKLKEIELILAEISKKEAEAAAAKMAEGEKDEKYSEAITLADNAFGFENYKQAKLKYNEALLIKSEEQYPKDKLKEIEIKLAEIAKKNEEDVLAAESARKKREYYDAVIAEADAELSGKNYEEATAKYTQALGVIPGEKYPNDKINEIKAILNKIEANNVNSALAQKELDAKYSKLIAEGDNAFGTKNYTSAKSKYMSALSIKSNEQYPKNKLSEIEKILAKIAAKDAEITLTNNAQKQKEEQYNSLIKIADTEFATKKYSTAISNYSQALGLIPNKTYPKEKIDEINKILAELAKKNKDNKKAALAEKEKRNEYNKLIFDGDRSMKLKEYTNAQVAFKSALNLYGNEQYPKNKLADILAILNKQSEPKEVIVSNNNYSGTRAKITDDKEKEIEARMAAFKNKHIIKKDKELQKDKEAYNNQEEIMISAAIDRTDKADEEIEKYVEAGIKQTELGNQYHLDNSEMLLATTKLLEKAENKRIKNADKRRNEADEDFEIYEKQQHKFVKEQENLSIDKAEAHYIYVDNLSEAELIMIEKGDKVRADNRVYLERLTEETIKNQKRNKERREEMELDVHKYKEELAKGNEILVSASVDRTAKNGEDIALVSEGVSKMVEEKSSYYKLNVKELIEFKARIDQLEQRNVERADKIRVKNQKVNDKYVTDIKRNEERQNIKYYEDVEGLDEYEKEVLKYETVNRKKAAKKRNGANNKIVNAIETLGSTSQSQEKRYKEFQVKLDEKRKNNEIFHSDLQAIEKKQMLLADEALEGFYMGEKRVSDDSELTEKYPQGITEETIESGNSIVIKRTKVTGTHADVYERVFYTWGGTYFYNNGVNIAQSLWDKESID